MSGLADPTSWTDREREFFAAGWNECLKMQPGENGRLRAALDDALIWLDPEAKNESRYDHRDLMLAAIRAALGHQQGPKHAMAKDIAAQIEGGVSQRDD